MPAVAETLGALARVLDSRGLRWFVFGAQAIAVRGAPRTTQDVYVTVEIERSRLGELTGALAAAGFTHRYPEIADELRDRSAVVPLVHTSGMDVDLVLAGPGLESLALDRATRVEIAGVLAPVARATDLAVMKVLAGRGKDLDDLRSLLASGDLDRDEARDLLAQFERALGRSDLLPVLEAAIAELDAD